MTISPGQSEMREQLLAAQTSNPALRVEYERKLNAMFEEQLSTPKKMRLKVLTLFSVICGGGALTLGITETLPTLSRVVLLTGAAFALAWAVYFIQLLLRGSYRHRVDAPMAAGMAFGFSWIMCGLLAFGLPIEQVLLISMLFLLPAGLILLRTIVRQSEMRTQEQLVELQYRIARLAEKFDSDSGDAAGGVLR